MKILGENTPKTNCEPREIVWTYGMFLLVLDQNKEAYQQLYRSVQESGTPAIYWPTMMIAAIKTRNTDAAMSLIKEKLTDFPEGVWAIQLTRLAAGQKTLEEVLASIREYTKVPRNERRGEAQYIAGELALANGNREAAEQLFRQSVTNCMSCSIVSVLAAQRVSAMNQGQKKSSGTEP